MLNELARQIYENAVKKGFYEKPIEMGTRIALIHSEISEALEADRKQRYCISDVEQTNDLVTDIAFKLHFECNVKDTFQDELADTIIRCLDTAAYKGIDIEAHIKAKMRYNSLREKMHGKKY